MTTPDSTLTEVTSARQQNAFWSLINRLPGAEFFNNLKIGYKLVIGFGILVLIILLLGGLSYLSIRNAINKIDDTVNVRAPVAIASARAQTDLLGMLGSVRGYLALGDARFRQQYQVDRQNFENSLLALQRQRSRMGADNQERLDLLQETFDAWVLLPEPLFDLRDDRLAREGAYNILATDGVKYGGQVLISTQDLIEEQAKEIPSTNDVQLLADMASFQGSFSALLSGMRNYVTTRNHDFRGEYESNLNLNNIVWTELQDGLQGLDDGDPRLAILEIIDQNRQAFLALEETVFNELESETWRRDLYLFNTEAHPVADEMRLLLKEITDSQVTVLREGLQEGATELKNAQQRILVGGILATLLAVWMTFTFRAAIAGPVVRLTEVAERIRSGDLEAQAEARHKDETGILASTFNAMTAQLRSTLLQVRKEKRRADDLLHVVIPIGVDLSSEKDFNRLLEKILVEAKAFCHAQAGILYLLRKEEQQLEYVIVRNDARHVALGGTTGNKVPFDPLPLYKTGAQEAASRHVAVQAAISGDPINIADAYIEADDLESEWYDFSGPQELELNGQAGDETPARHATSWLAIPLANNREEVIGIIQLMNARDADSGQVIAFDPNLQQMMESFSSLAVAALEAYMREEGLRQEIQKLRIEIDEVKRQEHVQQIVDSDFFQDLRARADSLRQRVRGPRNRPSSEDEDQPEEDTSSETDS